MSDCEGDFKCDFCKGYSEDEPIEKYGACFDSILHKQIDELEATIEQHKREINGLRSTISSVLQTLPPCNERIGLQFALNPKLLTNGMIPKPPE